MQNDARAFGSARDWNDIQLDIGVCVETVTKEGRGQWSRGPKRREVRVEFTRRRER